MTDLTTTEAAAALGCSRQAVLDRIRRRTLPARKNDRGRWRISAENLASELETL
jgi:excisionase family DNA binding protein